MQLNSIEFVLPGRTLTVVRGDTLKATFVASERGRNCCSLSFLFLPFD